MTATIARPEGEVKRRYTLDARQRDAFEQYARGLKDIIPRCGGDLVGYWLPTKFAGPTNIATAMINFPSLAAYEQYRERLGKDAESVEHSRQAEETGCILVEDRSFLEQVQWLCRSTDVGGASNS